MHHRGVAVLCVVLAFGGVAAPAGADGDGGRDASRSYVASPGHLVLVDPGTGPAGVGMVRFAVAEADRQVDIRVDDAAGPLQRVQAWAVFRQEAPIVVQVAFCDRLVRAIPPGTSVLDVVLDDALIAGGPSVCPGDHGATVGTVHVRFT